MTLSLRAVLPLALLGLAPAGALAADYDPPIYVEEADNYVPVEVGTGWYLRGDVGYTLNRPYREISTLGGFTENTSLLPASIGMGYQFNSFLRGELNFGILPAHRFGRDYISNCPGTQTTTVVDNLTGTLLSQNSVASSRGCDGSDRVNNYAYSLMAHGFVDLGTYVGFTPFIGGGVGVTYNKHSLVVGDLDCQPSSSTTIAGGNTTTTSFACDIPGAYDGARQSEGRYDFSYSLAAGIAYQATKNISLELGYEYFASPSARYMSYSGGGYTVNRGIDFHQVKLGVRYALW